MLTAADCRNILSGEFSKVEKTVYMLSTLIYDAAVDGYDYYDTVRLNEYMVSVFEDLGFVTEDIDTDDFNGRGLTRISWKS